MRWLIYLGVLVGATTAAALPEGEGLAAKYPGDVDLRKDKAVIFVERFDQNGVEALAKRWESVRNPDEMALVKDGAPGSADGQALQITHVGGQGDGSHLYRRLQPGYDQIFARWYVKFAPECAQVHHFGTHLGGYNPSTPWPQGGAGNRPDGTKSFCSGVEPFGPDWGWDFYTYWQGMRRHGDGRYWGTPFHTGGSKRAVEKGKWICVEMMIKMNDPVSASNGEQAFWIDGKLWRRDGQVVSHAGPGFPMGQWTGGWWRPDATATGSFEGFRWRTSAKLKINYLWTYLYMTRSPVGHVSKVWFDNIVVAREYIGPIAAREN